MAALLALSTPALSGCEWLLGEEQVGPTTVWAVMQGVPGSHGMWDAEVRPGQLCYKLSFSPYTTNTWGELHDPQGTVLARFQYSDNRICVGVHQTVSNGLAANPHAFTVDLHVPDIPYGFIAGRVVRAGEQPLPATFRH